MSEVTRAKEKQKAKWKGGASKVNPLQVRSERPVFKEQKKISLFSLSLLSLLCLAIKSRVLCTLQWLRLTEHACEWGGTAGDRYIFTNIYMHIEKKVEKGRRGKDIKTEINRNKKVDKMVKEDGEMEKKGMMERVRQEEREWVWSKRKRKNWKKSSLVI